MGSEFTLNRARSTVRTTDATPTIALEVDIASPTAGFAKLDVVAANNTRILVWAIGRCRPWRANGGVVVLAGTERALYTPDGDAGLNTCLATMILSGTKLQVQVTGVAATVIDWLINLEWSVN